MVIIVLIIFCVLFYIAKTKVRDLFSKVVVYSFLGYWGFSLTMTSMSVFDIYPVSIKTYCYVLLAIIAFFAGLLTVKIPRAYVERDEYSEVLSLNITRLLGNYWFIALILWAAYFCYKYSVIAMTVASFQDHAEMADQYEQIFQNNSTEQFLFGFIIMPVFHVSSVLLSFLLLNYKQMLKKYLFQFVVLIVLLIGYILISGGRVSFVILAMYLFVTYCCTTSYKKVLEVKFSKLLKVLAVTIFILFGISIMTNYKDAGRLFGGTTASVSREEFGEAAELAAQYSVLPVVMFDYALEHDYDEKFGLQFGKATLTGVDSWVEIILNRFGIKYKSSRYIMEYFQETIVQYSATRYANYAYTGILYHYLDFGILGILFFPFIFGLCMRRIIKELYRRPSVPLFFLFGLAYFMMMHSVFTCYFIKSWVISYIAFLFIWNKLNQNLPSVKIKNVKV